MILLFKTKRKVIFVKQINDDSKDTVMYALLEEITKYDLLYCPELETDKVAKLDHNYDVYDPYEFIDNNDTKLNFDKYKPIGSFYVTNDTIMINEI